MSCHNPALSPHIYLEQIENLDTQVRDWSSPRAIPELKLPGPNPFIPQMLSVIVPRGKILKAGEKVEPPKVVENLPDAGMWRVRATLCCFLSSHFGLGVACLLACLMHAFFFPGTIQDLVEISSRETSSVSEDPTKEKIGPRSPFWRLTSLGLNHPTRPPNPCYS